MTYRPDVQPWAVQTHHFDGVDVILAGPAGVNHLGFNHADAQWLHLQQSGPPARITAGEAIMLRPADIDLIIRTSWDGRCPMSGTPAASRCPTRSALPRRRC
jgi:hypothetical protein